LCFFVLYCDLLALKVSKRASYSETTEYSSEDNIAALALDSLLFVLATRLEVLAELDAAALAAHNRPGVAQVRTDQLVPDYEANDSRRAALLGKLAKFGLENTIGVLKCLFDAI